MRVEMPLLVRLAVGGRLVETHGVGKADLKEIVVAHISQSRFIGALPPTVEQRQNLTRRRWRHQGRIMKTIFLSFTVTQ